MEIKRRRVAQESSRLVGFPVRGRPLAVARERRVSTCLARCNHSHLQLQLESVDESDDDLRHCYLLVGTITIQVGHEKENMNKKVKCSTSRCSRPKRNDK